MADHGTSGNRRRGGGGSGPRRGGSQGRGGGQQGQRPPVMEVAARSARGALKRHAESVKGHDVQLACRSLLVAFHGASTGSTNPGELLNLLEQVAAAVEQGAGAEAQLPVALRAVVGYAAERPARTRAVEEMLRLSLRWAYVQSADYVPRQLRNDGGFRASAIREELGTVAREYLDDASFEQGRS